MAAQEPQRSDHRELPHLFPNAGQSDLADLVKPWANHAHKEGSSGLSILLIRPSDPGEGEPQDAHGPQQPFLVRPTH
jgi:hypothetical protein